VAQEAGTFQEFKRGGKKLKIQIETVGGGGNIGSRRKTVARKYTNGIGGRERYLERTILEKEKKRIQIGE